MNEKLYEQEFESANRPEMEAEEAALTAEAIAKIEEEAVENAMRQVEEAVEPHEARKSRTITAAEILARIDTIIACDNSDELVQRIVDIPVNESPHGGLDGQARAEAIKSVILSKATTNQRALELLERMYDDVSAADPAAWKQQFAMQTRASVIEMLQKAMQKALDEGDMERFKNLRISINVALRDM